MNEPFFPRELVAERLAVSPATLIRYESRGLIHAVPRGDGDEPAAEGYGPGEVRRLWTIITFQRDLGINLAGVEVILPPPRPAWGHSPAPRPPGAKPSESGRPRRRRVGTGRRVFMSDHRFRPHERIVDPAVFRLAFDRKKSVADRWLIVYGVANGKDHARLGISVSKRRIRRAADRNEFKRFVREAFRLGKAELPPGIDLIIVPRGARLTFHQARISLPALAKGVARRLAPASPRPESATPP